jgi:two-component system, response regulator
MKHSILMVEDNPGYVKLAKLALRPIGLEEVVVNIPDAADALTYLKHIQPLPSFIILDLNMPGFDGFDLLKAIRENDRLQNLRVAVISTGELPGNKDFWPNRYVEKPHTFDEYSKLLQDLCKEWDLTK